MVCDRCGEDEGFVISSMTESHIKYTFIDGKWTKHKKISDSKTWGPECSSCHYALTYEQSDKVWNLFKEEYMPV